MKRSMALILGAAAIATLTGCPFGSAYTGPTACALLTAPLASSVIGNPAKQTSSEKLSDYVTKCEYANGLNTVSVEAGSWGWYSHTAKGPAVAGLGDEAYMSPSGLLVRKAGNAILVNLTVSGDFREPVAKSAAREDKLKKQLAAKLIANL